MNNATTSIQGHGAGLATGVQYNRNHQLSDVSAASQRQRILAALVEAGADGITTIQARRDLNVMQPAPRIKELRERGYKIETFLGRVFDEQERPHPKVATYVLMPTSAKGGAHD